MASCTKVFPPFVQGPYGLIDPDFSEREGVDGFFINRAFPTVEYQQTLTRSHSWP